MKNTKRSFKDMIQRDQKIKLLYSNGWGPVAISRKLKISYVTVWRYLRLK